VNKLYIACKTQDWPVGWVLDSISVGSGWIGKTYTFPVLVGAFGKKHRCPQCGQDTGTPTMMYGMLSDGGSEWNRRKDGTFYPSSNLEESDSPKLPAFKILTECVVTICFRSSSMKTQRANVKSASGVYHI
jgi:hypothetical protein